MSAKLSLEKNVSHFGLRYNPRQYGHTDEVVYSSVNHLFFPKTSGGILLARLDEPVDSKEFTQINYDGRLRQFSRERICENLLKRGLSSNYEILLQRYNEAKEILAHNEPLMVTENQDVLVAYRKDKYGGYPLCDLSVFTFGNEPTTDEPGARFKIRFSGDFQVRSITDINGIPKEYLKDIGESVERIRQSLEQRKKSGFRTYPRKYEKNGNGGKKKW